MWNQAWGMCSGRLPMWRWPSSQELCGRGACCLIAAAAVGPAAAVTGRQLELVGQAGSRRLHRAPWCAQQTGKKSSLRPFRTCTSPPVRKPAQGLSSPAGGRVRREPRLLVDGEEARAGGIGGRRAGVRGVAALRVGHTKCGDRWESEIVCGAFGGAGSRTRIAGVRRWSVVGRWHRSSSIRLFDLGEGARQQCGGQEHIATTGR
mmetsp:Transcript_4711/g.14867  ORF Transcript_4711/g.14867 Transcript_4711/m.14867 type:complete len:205 (+) Transcript_4711:707-1321(+)